MRMRTIELGAGAFVLAGALAFIILMVQVSGVSFAREVDNYTIYAQFDDVAGLRKRSKVSMSGVSIGRVTNITVDTVYGRALVEMEINGAAGPLSADTGARILTEGLLGARYVGLMPGADDETLGPGDYIEDTQGAIVLENLIGELVTRLGGS